MRSLSFVLLAATALVAPNVALAADLDARSRIDAVTVYPDAALVTRTFDVELPAGASSVTLRGLPFSLDPASLRVAGAGSGAISIGAVEARTAPADVKTDSGLDAKLKGLRSDRDGWQVTIDALTAKQAMINRYAQASPEKLSPDAKPLDLAQWNAAFDTVGAALAKVGDELRAARVRAREIDEDIAAIETSRPRQTTKPPLRDVTIALNAAAQTKATLTLSYRVSGASWRPAYEAKLDTGGPGRKPGLDFTRRAQVSQRTGEDWSDVALSLSTTRASRGSAAPDVQPERLAFWEPPMPLAAGAARQAPAPAMKAMRADGKLDETANAPAAAPPPVAATEQQASIDANAWAASFVTPGRVSVPADGTAKNLSLTTRHIEPTLNIRTAPELDPTAYLQARLTNDEEAPLLPGPVTVQRDGALVGQGALPLVAPGDSFDLGFGADDRVKVVRVPVKKKENEPTWYNQTKIDTREFKTTIRNLHDFAIRATVVDRIPFSDNTAITVELLPQTTAPTEKQVGDKRGVMAWSYDLAAGEQKEIRLAWRMKWPADRDVILQPAPVPSR